MKNLSQDTLPARVILIGGIISLFLSSIAFWIRMISSPELRTGTDFIAFYTAGRIASESGYAKVYDLNAQRNIQAEVVGFPLQEKQFLLYNHLPFTLPLLSLVIERDYVISFFRWVFVSGLFYLAAILVLIKSLLVEKSQHKKIILALLTFFPFTVSLILGQDTAIFVLGMSLFTSGFLKEKDWLTGLGLSIGLIRPHILAAMLLPVALKRPKAFLFFTLFGTLWVASSFLLLGLQGSSDFIHSLAISAGGEWYGMHEESMFNFFGLFARLFPSLQITFLRAVAWTIFAVNLLFLAILWAKIKNPVPELLSLSLTLSLVAAPHLHYHDLTLLAIPIIVILERAKTQNTSLTLVTLSLLLLFSQAISFLYFSLPYLLIAILSMAAFRRIKTLSSVGAI